MSDIFEILNPADDSHILQNSDLRKQVQKQGKQLNTLKVELLTVGEQKQSLEKQLQKVKSQNKQLSLYVLKLSKKVLQLQNGQKQISSENKKLREEVIAKGEAIAAMEEQFANQKFKILQTIKKDENSRISKILQDIYEQADNEEQEQEDQSEFKGIQKAKTYNTETFSIEHPNTQNQRRKSVVQSSYKHKVQEGEGKNSSQKSSKKKQRPDKEKKIEEMTIWQRLFKKLW